MGLRGRDALTTFLAGLTVVVVLAVSQGWGWPLLGDYRSGVIALGILGFAAGCGYPDRGWNFAEPAIWFASVLGGLALLLLIGGLITGAENWFFVLAADLLALWLLATARHALGQPRIRAGLARLAARTGHTAP